MKSKLMKKFIKTIAKEFILVSILLSVFLLTVNAQLKDTMVKPARKIAGKLKPLPPKPIIIPTPEYINQPYYYDEGDNKLTRLENVNARVTTKKKNLGIGGARKFYTINGGTSKVLFTASKNICFIIKTNGDMMDLTSFIKLYKFTTAEDKRETLISEKEGIIKNKEESKSAIVMVNVKKLTRESYLISASQTFEAGEYGFVLMNAPGAGQELTIFAFGIDWKKSD